MLTVNIHEAKMHLSQLVEKAAHGEPFVIAKAGRPLVKVIDLGGYYQIRFEARGFSCGSPYLTSWFAG